MNDWAGKRVMVFHAGALGDFVLIWPLLRAIKRAGASVTIVADSSKAKLAAGELGIEGVGSELPWVSSLWSDPRSTRLGPIRGPADRSDVIISFAADEITGSGRRWIANARRTFDAGEVLLVGPPGSSGRARLWERCRVGEQGGVEPRSNPIGRVMLHVGAGSLEKQWPLERWSSLAVGLRARGRAYGFIAGEAEAERFTPDQKKQLAAMGGHALWSLDELATAIRSASLFIGCDSGPTHLAAQLGIPTIALFGPTDPASWSPIGPGVTVLCPDSPRPMDWLTVDRVFVAVP